VKIKLILGSLGLLVVFAVLVVGTHLGDLVKSGLETLGPKVTQTTLIVDNVNLSLFAGSAGVQGLVLGNPAGYKSLASINVSNAAIRLAPGSVLSDKIVIHSIEVRAPEITFEGNPLGANNLAKIMANVKGTNGPMDQAHPNTPTASPTGPAKPAKKLEVDDFLITSARVHASLAIPGVVNQELTLTLPDIHLTDLGKGPDGITAADLTQVVLSQITTATVSALLKDAASMGKDLTKAARAAATGVLQNSSNAVGANVDKLKKGLGGLLGK